MTGDLDGLFPRRHTAIAPSDGSHDDRDAAVGAGVVVGGVRGAGAVDVSTRQRPLRHTPHATKTQIDQGGVWGGSAVLVVASVK